MHTTPEHSARACGPCQACCHVKPIPPLEKAAWSDCRHQCAQGCAIYAARPRGCSRYTCAWIDGWGQEADRPDRLGVLFEMAPGPVGGLEVRAIEVRPEAAAGERAQARQASWIASGARLSLLRYDA